MEYDELPLDDDSEQPSRTDPNTDQIEIDLAPPKKPDLELVPVASARDDSDDLKLIPVTPTKEVPPSEPENEIYLSPPSEPENEIYLSPKEPDPSSLKQAETLLNRVNLVSGPLFKEVRRWPEYRRVLATSERCAQFEEKLLDAARMIDSRLDGDMLPADALQELVTRLARRFAAWEHSTERQKERQRKQAAARRRSNRGRDLQIVRAAENGDSQRAIALQFRISRGAVEHVLLRDAPNLLKRRKTSRQPPD